MIKIEYLRYFKVTTEKGSFAAAAEALHVSATSVVHGINSLEDHFGTSLFVRRKSIGITLTPDGQKLLERVRLLMLEIESIDEIFKNKKQKLKGELVVGCQEGLSWCLTPRVIAELSCRHPDLKVITKTTWMDSRYAALESGEVDILVTFLVNETAPSVYNAAVLCQPGTVAMMRQGHPLDNGKKVHLKELAKYEQVMINDGPGFNLFHAMYEERGLNPERMSMSNISTSAQSIVGCSDAVSLRILKPAHHLSPLGDEIVYPALADKVKGPDIVAITHKARSSANALKQEVFISLCQELFSSGKMREHMVY